MNILPPIYDDASVFLRSELNETRPMARTPGAASCLIVASYFAAGFSFLTSVFSSFSSGISSIFIEQHPPQPHELPLPKNFEKSPFFSPAIRNSSFTSDQIEYESGS